MLQAQYVTPANEERGPSDYRPFDHAPCTNLPYSWTTLNLQSVSFPSNRALQGLLYLWQAQHQSFSTYGQLPPAPPLATRGFPITPSTLLCSTPKNTSSLQQGRTGPSDLPWPRNPQFVLSARTSRPSHVLQRPPDSQGPPVQTAHQGHPSMLPHRHPSPLPPHQRFTSTRACQHLVATRVACARARATHTRENVFLCVSHFWVGKSCWWPPPGTHPPQGRETGRMPKPNTFPHNPAPSKLFSLSSTFPCQTFPCPHTCHVLEPPLHPTSAPTSAPSAPKVRSPLGPHTDPKIAPTQCRVIASKSLPQCPQCTASPQPGLPRDTNRGTKASEAQHSASKTSLGTFSIQSVIFQCLKWCKPCSASPQDCLRAETSSSLGHVHTQLPQVQRNTKLHIGAREILRGAPFVLLPCVRALVLLLDHSLAPKPGTFATQAAHTLPPLLLLMCNLWPLGRWLEPLP